MKPFNVLSPDVDLHQHHLLEASAGTGKTFSIQNIVARLLVELGSQQEPLTLQKILVVTFTRVAARDLKKRIRLSIEQAVHYLTNETHSNEIGYLSAIINKGQKAVEEACRRLKQALFTFDQAQIFTIHSFCSRMLHQHAMESDTGMQCPDSENNPFTLSEIKKVVNDFFLTEMTWESISPAQLEIYLKEDPHQKILIKAVQTDYPISKCLTFQEIYLEFVNNMKAIKNRLQLNSTKMMEDYRLQSPRYRHAKGEETKEKTLKKAARFASLFDQNSWTKEDLDVLIKEGLVWLRVFNPELIKAKSSGIEKLHYPDLNEVLEKSLDPLLAKAADFSLLLARLASDCRQFLKRYQLEEEKLSHDDILHKMNHSLDQPAFFSLVQARYQAAIIDEFQDTDPLQWEIFQKLFLNQKKPWEGYLYLVGDPKQSIYSFRRADIYTYLDAAKALTHSFSLSVNYRSQPCLVEALNTLFSSDHLSQFIPLPKRSLHLSYQPVKPSPFAENQLLEEDCGGLHFFISHHDKKRTLKDLEENLFFPFIAQEIFRLQDQKKIGYSQFAILVRDRMQASRLSDYLFKFSIPALNQKSASLADSPALAAIKDCLQAVLNPRERGLVLKLLATPLICWKQEELISNNAVEFALHFIQKLRKSLFEKGLASFFHEILKSPSKIGGISVMEQILSQKEGAEFLRDYQQITDLIIQHEFSEWNHPEEIIPFLNHFHQWDSNEDEKGKRLQDPFIDAVKILTLHASKGLEFDIVFALGLVNRLENSEWLIPVESEGRIHLAPYSENSEERQKYCEEIDAEKMRQLYVALTRARLRTYIPVILEPHSKELKWTEASPMDLFLARFCSKETSSYQEIYQRIQENDGSLLYQFLETIGKPHFITSTILCEPIDPLFAKRQEQKSKDLHFPEPVHICQKPLWISSFSSLVHQIDKNENEKNIFQDAAPSDYESLFKNVHTLPANRETGLCIHRILERIHFSDFRFFKSEKEALPLLTPFLEKTPYKEWEVPIATLICNALKTSLPSISDSFCLADLDSGAMYREMPFLFSYFRENDRCENDEADGLMKGVIDLLFVHEGRYYLVDWKTNWLGKDEGAYTLPAIEKAMNESNYFLQASIYTEVMKRYLETVEPRAFEDCFGGVYYLFLRGMGADKENGIYHFFPSSHLQNKLLQEV